MNLKLIVLAATLAIGSIAQIAQAESVADKAASFAKTLRDDAANTVQIALDRVSSAESALRIAQAVSRDAHQVNEREAIRVATEAVAVAKQGLVDAEQLLKRARSLLTARENTVEEMKLWIHARRKIGALVVPIEGDVRVLKSGGSYGNALLGAVLAGERIETGPNSRARLFVSDGHGEIDLKENSLFTVLENDLVTGFSGALDKGFARLRTLQGYLEKKFEVRTPTAVTSVRATDFAVKILENGELVQVFKGVVTVTPSSGGDTIDVQAGTQRRYLNGQGFLPAEPLDATAQTVWSPNASDH